MIRLTYDPELVEEAVLLAETTMDRADARAFRRERDRLYDVADIRERDARFHALHARWFTRADLNRVIEQSLAEREGIAARLTDGLVVRALTRAEEGADLMDRVAVGAPNPAPILVLRIRSERLIDPERLRAFLRHELMHIADMLDPAFGYQRTAPSSDDGPSHDNLLRDRYRVLWDVTIDGRLANAGLTDAQVRDARRQEFATAFRMLGIRCEPAFDEWFDCGQPTHAGLLAFAATPQPPGPFAGHDGRCPLCRFPLAALDPQPERLSAGARAAIRARHSAWTIEQGLCSQCLDLYEARHAEAHGIVAR